MKTSFYRVTVVCVGLTESQLVEAVPDMLSEFTDRPWQTNVICEAKDGVLRLSAVNDFDSNGQALVDEFQDAVVANVRFDDRVSFGVESVSVLSRPADDQADSGEEPTFSKHSVVNNNQAQNS